MKLLIVFGTTEGQTRKISERVGERIRELGEEAEVYDSTLLPPGLDVDAFDAVIVAASLHQHRYQTSIAHFVKEHRRALAARPTAFMSVGLSPVLADGQDDAQACVDEFLAETGWHPAQVEHVAGALLYTQYDFFKRQIMKFIVWQGGGPADAGHDYEFTDWDALLKFTDSFVEMAKS